MDVDELHIKVKDRVGWNGASHGAATVSQASRNRELSLLANAHVLQALIPSLDDLTSTYEESLHKWR